jgi:heme exporter protein CcmD
MNQWAFVIAAYGVTIVATAALVAWSYWSMRSAEADAEALKRRK